MDVRKFPPTLTKGFVWVAGSMMAVAICVHLASYGPSQLGPSLMNIALALFPFLFLVFGPAVVVLRFGRIPMDRIYSGLPVYVYVVGVALLFYVAVDFFLLQKLLPGQPMEDGATFYFNNHGDHIPTTAEGYRTGLMHSARLFTGNEIIFFGVAALIAYKVDRIRSGRINLDAVTRDDALERSPLPYPLTRTVTLQTTLTPEVCAVRLLAFQPRSGWSFFTGSRGVRGEASAEKFRIELASSQYQTVYAVGSFETVGGATVVRVLLPFKRWALISLAASAILFPIGWAVLDGVGFHLPLSGVAIVYVFGIGLNVVFSFDQRRRLLGQIKQATGAKEIPAGWA
jgi:hypothetical protein